MADARTIFNSAVETSLLELERLGMLRVLRNEKVKAISTLASGQDLLAVTRPIFSLFSSFNIRFRQQNIRAPEENACIAGYDLHGSM